MADGTTIEWTDATWNPITGCSIVSPGCTNCYAMKLAGTRLKHIPSREGLTVDTKAGPVWNGKVRLNEEWLTQPLTWRRPRRVFVCAHGDLFAENVPDEWIDRVFAVMALAPRHTFQVLTKRAARMRAFVNALMRGERGLAVAAMELRKSVAAGMAAMSAWFDQENDCARPLPNVWLGVSAERQKEADERIPDLLATPAAVRFVSAEPLLGSIKMPGRYAVGEDGIVDTPALDWIIVGGESGNSARPMHPDWVRSIRDQCAAAGTAFFFKQWGAWGLEEPIVGGHEMHALADDGTLYRGADLAFPDGRRRGEAIRADHDKARLTAVYRVGKSRAGRLLDGVEHSAFPGASS